MDSNHEEENGDGSTLFNPKEDDVLSGLEEGTMRPREQLSNHDKMNVVDSLDVQQTVIAVGVEPTPPKTTASAKVDDISAEEAEALAAEAALLYQDAHTSMPSEPFWLQEAHAAMLLTPDKPLQQTQELDVTTTRLQEAEAQIRELRDIVAQQNETLDQITRWKRSQTARRRFFTTLNDNSPTPFAPQVGIRRSVSVHDVERSRIRRALG